MERALETVAYTSVALLTLSVVVDAIDDMALGNLWPGVTTALVGLVTASLAALVAYRQRQRNGNGEKPKGE